MKSIHVAAALIKAAGPDGNAIVFATQRDYGDYKDWWEFPGGKIEPDETAEAALIREIHEELDARIRVERFLTTVEYDYPQFHLTMDCFWCTLAEDHMQLLEHEDARWLPLDHLRQVNWLPADLLVIEAIEAESQTLTYYETYADAFISGTVSADMEAARQCFLKELPPGARILDFGCGSGRDAKAFLEAGYQVDAMDGSETICRKTTELTGIPVRKMLFQELEAVHEYDGIWACASILHLPRTELLDVLGRISKALKPGGVLYTSFKYGTFEGIRNGRYFTDFTEDTLKAFLAPVSALRVFDCWLTQDVRPGRQKERWINILARRES